jgi:hypothetical protein
VGFDSGLDPLPGLLVGVFECIGLSLGLYLMLVVGPHHKKIWWWMTLEPISHPQSSSTNRDPSWNLRRRSVLSSGGPSPGRASSLIASPSGLGSKGFEKRGGWERSKDFGGKALGS